MAWLADLNFVEIANAIVILITGLAVGLGFRNGTAKSKPVDSSGPLISVDAALVDSSSQNRLAAALEQHSRDSERERKVGHELTESVHELRKELSEVRNEMRLMRR